MMREMIAAVQGARAPDDDPWTSAHPITFPSDPAWQDACYRKMLERQRARKLRLLEAGDADDAQPRMDEDPLGGAPPRPAAHEWNIVPAPPRRAAFHAPQAARLARLKGVGRAPVTWTIEDVANAGRLLAEPPAPVEYRDEQEMRRVYTLIFDVFRYKTILGQALDDALFFREHPSMVPLTTRVWLLLYDLYHRSFKKRTTANAALAAALFPSAGLSDVERRLWEERVKLAASIARIRIKNKALHLSQLLPHHLRDEKSGPRLDAPLTCWVNTKKIKSPEEMSASISKNLNLRLIDESSALTDDAFKWDAHCPQFILFHPSLRSKLAQSVLVRKHRLIVQDKSFCLGPATFVKIVADLQLTGSVVQSHVNSPRTTAYLASILGQNDNIKRLLAFSAGSRKSEYESYFSELGIKNIAIFAEKMVDLPPDADDFEEVIAVFATPPNSCSAVADPIGLVCARGGDLATLAALTETEDTPAGRARVARILDEQKRTLQFAMSRPHIQFVLYETHSEIDAENAQMVRGTLREINGRARVHHAVAQGRCKGLRQEQPDGDDDDDDDDDTDDDHPVPDSDLFDVSRLPDLCANGDERLDLGETGCYLALVQRKQVTRMDNRHMIQMAERRGVFGRAERKPKHVVQQQRMRVGDEAVKANGSQQQQQQRRRREFEADRIATATKASMCHSKVAEATPCAKGSPTNAKVSHTRRWWAETTRHIASLRATVARQRPPPARALVEREPGDDDGDAPAHKFVDEVVARSRRNPHDVPVHPRLRLSRAAHKCESKVPVPVAVTVVSFPPARYW